MMSIHPLFFNDVSGSEVLLILVFILMFFGSKSIPGIARSMGRTIRQIKDASNDLQEEIRKSGVDMKKDLNLNGILQDTAREIQQPLDQYADDLEQSIRYQPPRNSHIPPGTVAETSEGNTEEVSKEENTQVPSVENQDVPKKPSAQE